MRRTASEARAGQFRDRPTVHTNPGGDESTSCNTAPSTSPTIGVEDAPMRYFSKPVDDSRLHHAVRFDKVRHLPFRLRGVVKGRTDCATYQQTRHLGF